MSATLPPARVADPVEFGRVAVLFGGTSAEREISLLSGRAVLDALCRLGIDAHAVDPGEDPVGRLAGAGFDRAFVVLHGRGGEDGTIQGLLELIGIPFTGSGVLGCALGMDKLRTKWLLAGHGIETPPHAELGGPGDFDAALARLGLPLMVKPAAEGSSIGLTRVESPGEMAAAYATAAACRCEVFAEAWIDGPEYTAAILGDTVLPLVRIDAASGFYDYHAKYFSDATRYVCPAGLDAADEAAYAALALRAFRAVGASGWGRVDFMVGAHGRPVVLEINTVPGMTSHSLVPMAAAEAGIGFDSLCWRILETSLGGPR